MSRAAWSLSLLVVAAIGCQPAAPPAPPEVSAARSANKSDTDPIQQLLDGMSRRLAIMHSVAQWKWNEMQAIDDPEREAAMLKGLGRKAQTVGLNPDWATAFFQAQIAAGKIVQRADFERWTAEKQSPFANVPDLQKELRPRIDAMNQQLVQALLAIQNAGLSPPELERRLKKLSDSALQGEGMTDAVREAALASWPAQIPAAAVPVPR